MVKFRDIDSHVPVSKFRTSKIDLKVPGQIECNKIVDTTSIDLDTPTLNITGNVVMGDNDFIQFGAGDDMSIGHNPDTNFINHAKQLQIKSTMSSGDSYKFLESARRTTTFLFASDNASGSERANYYMTIGNDDTGATNRSFCRERIRRQDGTGLHTIVERSQTGNDVDSAEVDTLCKAKFSNDVHVVDNKSIYLGDGNDFRLTHNGSDSFIQDAGTGNFHIRTNGTYIGISDTTSSTNYMAKFVKDGATELYHNKVKKFETDANGVTIVGEMQTTNTIVASGTGWATAASITPKFSITNGHTRTSFLIDLGEGAFSSASGNVVGENNSNPAFITRFTEATYGLIYKVFMVCLEPLAGGETDIDVSVSTSSLTRGQSTGISVIINGGTQQTETTYLEYVTGSGQALEDRYLYLTTGTGTNTNAYTAGKILVVVEGYKL